ncbi:hypothetical protein T11_6185 [Trichinella zimbabwensis]|uniref:Uncharacterized protein n=1 Tax=Trichinella zimbabwensis TaxID=268475 RepID=A0A0V1H338_9BILA|nr:hypothetical protein T11_6185 [Trichinella zimbabwensis]
MQLLLFDAYQQRDFWAILKFVLYLKWKTCQKKKNNLVCVVHLVFANLTKAKDVGYKWEVG